MSKQSVCPWWLGYFLLNPVRYLFQNPNQVILPFVKEGMTVLEPGPGMGFFTLPIARKVGKSGQVIVCEIQPQMLKKIKKRAAKAGLLAQIDCRLVKPEASLLPSQKGTIDLVWAFAVVHELPDIQAFFHEVAQMLKSRACLLLAEPSGHVNAARFNEELLIAGHEGFTVIERPKVSRSHAALLQKNVSKAKCFDESAQSD